MQINRISTVSGVHSANTLQSKIEKKETNRTYNFVPSFYGQDLVKSSIPKELKEVIPANTTLQELIKQAQSEENKLGQGANSIVYAIPHLDDYVLKVLNKDDPNKINMDEFPSNVNLGQPVWQDIKNPRLLVLKRIQGQEHSIPNWSRTIGAPLPVTTEQAKHFATQLSTIAKMPQETFDQLASDVKLLDEKGYKLDSINSNNLIVDRKNNQIHIIDYFKVKPQESHLYRNSCLDLIAVMCDFTLFQEYFDKMDYSEKQSSNSSIKKITDKMYKGCEKAGLSCDDERYVTYINETSKWFPIPSIKDEETGREYVRAYNVRMQDFIKMIYAPENWANNR